MDDKPKFSLRIDQPYKCEYAKSGESTCRECKIKIERGKLRLAKMVKMTTFDGTSPYWYHFDCFFKEYQLKSTGDIENFSCLRFEDQKRIENQIGKTSDSPDCSSDSADEYFNQENVLSESKISSNVIQNPDSDQKILEKKSPEISKRKPKRKVESDENGRIKSKKSKKSKIGKEEKLLQQSNLLYKYIDQLKELKKSDLDLLLVENNYDLQKCKGRKAEILADAMAFGALKRCPECKKGQLYFRIAGYICSGIVSDCAKCVYETTKPGRKPFKVPDTLKKTPDFLTKYKYERRKRIMSKVQEPVEAVDVTKAGPSNGAVNDEPGDGSKSRSTAFPERQTLVIKDGTAVDPQSELEGIAIVHKEGDRVYSEVLNKVDLHANQNSYYKLQLLKDEQDHFWFFTAWGRIGTDIGGANTEMFESLAMARLAFEQKFYDKTGNEYFNRHKIVRKANRYYPLEISYTIVGDEIKSELPEGLQKLIKMLFDVKMMEKEMKEFELDMTKMPLGKLSKYQILSAYNVLYQINQLIFDQTNSDKLVSQCELFYTLIPHTFDMDRPSIIRTNDAIEKKWKMLNALMEMEFVYKLIASVKTEDANDDLLKQYYLKLKTDLSVLNTKDHEYQLIQEYATNTCSTLKFEIMEAFKVCRHGEEERYKKHIGLKNKMLLWHGSRVTNFASILLQGLTIAPPGVHVSGDYYGKGVYFADMMAKSAGYCGLEFNNNIGIFVLCEVALGETLDFTDFKDCKINKAGMAIFPPGKHSVKNVGEFHPDPKKSKITDGGVIVPCGPTVSSGVRNKLPHNEFIVYDATQVKIRYLLMVQFWK